MMVLTRGDELVCPSCHTALEMSRASRVVGALGGLAAAYLAVQIVLGMSVEGKWVLTIVAAVVAYGCASALILFFLADLVVPPRPVLEHFPQAHK